MISCRKVTELTELNVSGPPQPHVVSQTGSIMRRIFIGSSGLRAGWGVAVFVALLIVLAAATYGLIRVLPLPPFDSGGSVTMTPFNKGIVDAVLYMITLIATAIMAKLERRKLADYGLGSRKAVRRFFFGSGCGFFFMSLLVFILFESKAVTFQHQPVPLHSAFMYGIEWFISMFFVGAFEEILFRGYLQWTLGRGLTFWGASLLLAILFGLAHGSNPGESHIGLVSAAVFGLLFSLSIWYTRSLWWAIGFHTTWNWGMTFFYGTPNSGLLAEGRFLSVAPRGSPILSGGATGPEGSTWMLPILLLAALVIYLSYRSSSSTPLQ